MPEAADVTFDGVEVSNVLAHEFRIGIKELS